MLATVTSFSSQLKLLQLPHLAPGCPSLYLFVRHEPSASITGAEVKFSLAISSMPFLRAWTKVRVETLVEHMTDALAPGPIPSLLPAVPNSSTHEASNT